MRPRITSTASSFKCRYPWGTRPIINVGPFNWILLISLKTSPFLPLTEQLWDHNDVAGKLHPTCPQRANYRSDLGLGIWAFTRGARPVWPAAGRVRVEQFRKIDLRVRVRVMSILCGAGAGWWILKRGYPPTRNFFFLHLKKNIFFFVKMYIL